MHELGVCILDGMRTVMPSRQVDLKYCRVLRGKALRESRYELIRVKAPRHALNLLFNFRAGDFENLLVVHGDDLTSVSQEIATLARQKRGFPWT